MVGRAVIMDGVLLLSGSLLEGKRIHLTSFDIQPGLGACQLPLSTKCRLSAAADA